MGEAGPGGPGKAQEPAAPDALRRARRPPVELRVDGGGGAGGARGLRRLHRQRVPDRGLAARDPGAALLRAREPHPRPLQPAADPATRRLVAHRARLATGLAAGLVPLPSVRDSRAAHRRLVDEPVRPAVLAVHRRAVQLHRALPRALPLGRRFARALWPGRPGERDVAGVAGILGPAELGLWRSLPNHDRRYTIRVAKLVEARLAGTEYAGEPRWLAAALLHDVGKLDASLGVVGRSVATVMGAVAGPVRVDRWAQTSGFRRRAAWYLHHDDRGADRIRAAGGRDEAARWARAPHPRDPWAAGGVPVTGAQGPAAAGKASARGLPTALG